MNIHILKIITETINLLYMKKIEKKYHYNTHLEYYNTSLSTL